MNYNQPFFALILKRITVLGGRPDSTDWRTPTPGVGVLAGWLVQLVLVPVIHR
jgi:hypothetical protein